MKKEVLLLAPIALFVYNRFENTKITLEALRRNDLAAQSDLVIFSDGPRGEEDFKAVQEVRDLIRTQQWCGSVRIVESRTNKGLARSIREGVDLIFKDHETVVVLEDDIETASGFLNFMNSALDFFENDQEVMHIGAYVPESIGQKQLPEIWSAQFMSCWGWATWKNSWNKCLWDADFLLKRLSEISLSRYTLNGAINFRTQLEENARQERITWAIFWFTTIALMEKRCVYPSRSIVRNIGLTGGENFRVSERKVEEAPEYVRQLSKKKSWDHASIDHTSITGEKYLEYFYRYRSRTLWSIFRRFFGMFAKRFVSRLKSLVLLNWSRKK